MHIMKHLMYVVFLIPGILISSAFAQPANLVLENMTISTTEIFEATNSIKVGPNFIITSSGDVTLDAPSVNLRNLIFVIEGGKLLVISETTAVDVKSNQFSLPTDFSLDQNYPNPFNPSTTISYQLPNNSFVTLKVYDVIGNEIVTLVNEEKSAGEYKIDFDASKIGSGIYFYTLSAGEFLQTKKMILVK